MCAHTISEYAYQNSYQFDSPHGENIYVVVIMSVNVVLIYIFLHQTFIRTNPGQNWDWLRLHPSHRFFKVNNITHHLTTYNCVGSGLTKIVISR